MKKIFNIVLWVLLLAAVAAGMAFVEKQHKETICKGFDLLIINPSADMLMKAGDVKSGVLEATGELTGRQLGEIDLHQIRHLLENNPYVARADIRADISGHLKVEIMLRKAVMRINNLKGLSYYLDTEGWLIPLNPGHPARVIIASGYINDGISEPVGKKIHVSTLPKGSVVNRLYEMAMLIDQSAFLQKLITQIWVGRKGEVEIMPAIGDYKVKFGAMEEMQTKLEKLETFYREGVGKTGWIDYHSIDLSYKNQIICSKK